ERVADRVCFASPAVSDDGSLLAYAICWKSLAGDFSSEIHVRRLSTGEDRALATLSGAAGRIRIAPSGDRLVVATTMKSSEARSSGLVDDRGGAVQLPAGWTCIGWQGRDRLLLASTDEMTRLAVAEAGSEQVRQFFP